MPDLFAHFASGYLIGRIPSIRSWSAFLTLGAILPDLLTRIPEIILDRFLGIPIYHFVEIFHSPLCLLLTSFAISLLIEHRARSKAFLSIFLGSTIHVVLDLMQKQFGSAIYMPFFPFSLDKVQWGLFHFNASIVFFPLLLILVFAAWILPDALRKHRR
jgi:hypothetical protein